MYLGVSAAILFLFLSLSLSRDFSRSLPPSRSICASPTLSPGRVHGAVEACKLSLLALSFSLRDLTDFGRWPAPSSVPASYPLSVSVSRACARTLPVPTRSRSLSLSLFPVWAGRPHTLALQLAFSTRLVRLWNDTRRILPAPVERERVERARRVATHSQTSDTENGWENGYRPLGNLSVIRYS